MCPPKTAASVWLIGLALCLIQVDAQDGCKGHFFTLHQTSTAAINHVPFCEALNMTLATIHSQEDQNIVVSWLLDQDRSQTLQGLVHIGLFRCTLAPPPLRALCADAGNPEEFIWADGTPFVPGTSYAAWADDQPSEATWTLIDPEARRYGISPNNDPGWVMGFADYWGLCQSTELVYNCHPLASCSESEGNSTCTCNAGYSGDGVTECVDIDECALGTHDCACDGSCMNNLGGFTCLSTAHKLALHQTSTAAINHVPFCEALNMTLATIHSQEDQDFVVSWLLDQDRSQTLQGLVHIGLFRCTLAPPPLQALCADAGNPEEFIWADGTPFVPGTSYAAWADDQPSEATWTLIDPEARRYGISPNNDPGWVMGFADYWGLCGARQECIHFCRDGIDNCDPEATCAYSPGSFTCTCNAGFAGDGVVCNPTMHILPAADGDVANVPFSPVWEGRSDYLYVEGRVRDGQSISIIEFEGLPPDSQIVNATLALFKRGDMSDARDCENLFVLQAGVGDVADHRTRSWSWFSPRVDQTFHIPDLGAVHLDVTDLVRRALSRNAGVLSVLVQAASSRCKAAFASKEDPAPDTRPSLTVAYERCPDAGCDARRRTLAPTPARVVFATTPDTATQPPADKTSSAVACEGDRPPVGLLLAVSLLSAAVGAVVTLLAQRVRASAPTASRPHDAAPAQSGAVKCDVVCCQ